VTKTLLYALLGLIGLGVVISLLPAPKSPALAEVQLSNVRLELYPAADPDAKWQFRAKDVVYNPETRESKVLLSDKGYRLVDGKINLELKASELTIDSSENLRLENTDVYVPESCFILRMQNRDENGHQIGFVTIDQNTGYNAPLVLARAPTIKSKTYGFGSDFAIKNTKSADDPRNKDSWDLDSNETCEDIKREMNWR
jgi:hypothetical protein